MLVHPTRDGDQQKPEWIQDSRHLDSPLSRALGEPRPTAEIEEDPIFGPYGIDKKYKLKSEELAPLTDAGLTPYRGLKKLRAAGVVDPDRLIAVFGAGGLGTYAVQYAKLLSSGASVVAFARSEKKLAVAKEHGADYVINMRGKSLADIRSDPVQATGQREIDGAIDCVGAEESIRTGFGLLATSGAFVSVGLVGNRIDMPLFPLVAREYTYYGSFWGNYTDLSEVMTLAQAGRIKHSLKRVRFEDINETLKLLGDGDIVGRAVVTFGEAAGR
jgi:propanol-preferring alcohol dehydrogenase